MPRVHFANIGPSVTSTTRQRGNDSDSDCGSDKEFVPVMLRLSPNKNLVFSRGDGNEVSVDLHSVCKFPVTYKIQTTSPEKFRVKPRCGILKNNDQVTVNILLKPEHHLSDQAKDKFLIMCMLMPEMSEDMSTQQLNELWKQVPTGGPEVEQHRLCCVYKDAGEGHSAYSGGGEVSKDGNVNDLSKHAKHLEKQLRNTQILQYVTIIFLLLLTAAVIYLMRIQTMGGPLGSCTAQPGRSDIPPGGHPKSKQ